MMCESEEYTMDFKIVRELKRIESSKKCGLLTCVHYAGGYCVGCDTDSECEFSEKTCSQD
jgi:hypothetical protein